MTRSKSLLVNGKFRKVSTNQLHVWKDTSASAQQSILFELDLLCAYSASGITSLKTNTYVSKRSGMTCKRSLINHFTYQ